MIKNNSNWWDTISGDTIERRDEINTDNFVTQFLRKSLDSGITIKKGFKVGTWAKDFNDKMKAFLTSTGLNAPLFVLNEGLTETFQEVYRTDDSVFFVERGQGKKEKDMDISMEILTTDPKVYSEFQVLSKGLKRQKTKESHVYLIVQRNGGLGLESLGLAGNKIILDNYAPEVVEKFDRVVKDLKSTTPAGRLTIIDGPPGTGKSYLIRALVSSVADCAWVFVPSEMVAGLSGPNLASVLLDYREEGRPIVLVVEDADECLTQRSAQNMSSISTLLNVSDGILGQLVDIRVVCTTNTPFEELDKASKREGRLLERIEVDSLSGEQAAEVYKKLAGQAPDPSVISKNQKYTLANIYALARSGKARIEPERRKAGFLS
jgi:hypothetical protein